MITRFAPSPTGPLHLGHAYSALYAFDLARKTGGKFLLRIEDIDQSRSRQHWVDQIYEDLEWLGIQWVKPTRHQSENLASYHKALLYLDSLGLVYNCTCTRKDIQTAASAPQEGADPMFGPDGIIYSGTCRQNLDKSIDYTTPIRLSAERAFEHLNTNLSWLENVNSNYLSMDKKAFLTSVGDVVLSRRDMGTSYHLAVVIDDAEQSITDVVRGQDLADATPIHVLLQNLLDLPTPTYHHHGLIRDENGKRLAKRDDAKAISVYRENGASPEDIRQMVRLPAP